MSAIIAIANEKGGVGKTTTALSLGAALAQDGQHVLLIDLDAQGDLTIAVGIEPGHVERSIANALLGPSGNGEIVYSTRMPGMDIIPSNAEMKLIERLLPMRADCEATLREILRSGDYPRYDVILLDCPPVAGMITLNALAAANLLLIPTQAEYFSIHALRSIMEQLRKTRAGANPGLVYRMVITLLDRRNRTHRILSEQLRATFGPGLMGTMIEIDTKLRETPIAGIPINQFAPRSRAALQYQALAQEITPLLQQILQPGEPTPA